MSLNDMVEKLLRLSDPTMMMEEISEMGRSKECAGADQFTGVIRMVTPVCAHEDFNRGKKSESNDKITDKVYSGKFLILSESTGEIIREGHESYDILFKNEDSESTKIEYEITEYRYDKMILRQIEDLKITMSNEKIYAEIEKGGNTIANIEDLLRKLDIAKEVAKDTYFDNMPDFRKAIVMVTQKVEMLYKGEKAAKKSKPKRNKKPRLMTEEMVEFVGRIVEIIISAQNHEEAIRQLKKVEPKFIGIGNRTLFTKSTQRLNVLQMAKVISEIGSFKFGEKFPKHESVKDQIPNFM